MIRALAAAAYRLSNGPWQPLAALYREHDLLPIRHATDMSAADLKLAALVEEAATK